MTATKKTVATSHEAQEIWGDQDVAEETTLMTLPQLAKAMEKAGVINCTYRTYQRWATGGLSRKKKKHSKTLKIQWIGNVRYSTIRWAKEFIGSKSG